MIPTKIVCIGAGSASFGLNTLATLLRSPKLRGSHIALVDRNPEALRIVTGLAEHLNREWDAGMTISAHTHHLEALPEAEFVVSAIEVPPREALWKSDYEIPLKYGVRQPYAENGGPGGFAHAARNIGPVLEIAYDIEQTCPDALLINYTNPMQRICDAVARYSSVKVVGLCHQIGAGYAMVGKVLDEYLGIDAPDAFGIAEQFHTTHSTPRANAAREQVSRRAMERVDIKAAGVNHFTWMLALHERATGKDLYPIFREQWTAFDPTFEPLTRRVFDAFGLFPIPGDEHLCEYLPWASDPLTKPWEKYELDLYEWDLRAAMRDSGHADMQRMAAGELSVEPLLDVHSEGAVEVIENLAGDGTQYWDAVNLPNQGYIPNLPEGAIVEVPGLLSGAGVLGVGVGPLPDGIAELLRREITVSQLCVDAVVQGDRQIALQCLLLDPVITDLDVARQVLDDYLLTYKQYLPSFWEK
jgi:alpha-galactosidase